MVHSSRRRSLIVLCIGATLALLAVVIVEANSSAVEASNLYQGNVDALQAQLDQAGNQGYTKTDLGPIYDQKAAIQAAEPPIWIGDRAGFYRSQVASISHLKEDLGSRKATVLSDAKSVAAQDVADAAAKIDHDDQIGVDSSDLDSLRTTLSGLKQMATNSSRLGDFRNVSSESKSLTDRAGQLGAAQEAINQQILAGAAQLKVDKQGNVEEIRKTGVAALADGRNAAAAASMLNSENRLTKPWLTIQKPYGLLEKLAAGLNDQDVDKVAYGASAAARYANAVKAALLDAMPAKAILLDYTAQELWAYEGPKQVLDTLVTTGRPQLPTDIGPMSVLWKSSPWTMHSPWPAGSPWFYPDTQVAQVLWFTNTGEGLHDAEWEYDYQYGPGGQFGGGASHGCVHVPTVNERFLFPWADMGTPVIVYPGDGTPLANQLSQVTVDTSGQPTTGPKGA